jgi:hypothetical protein
MIQRVTNPIVLPADLVPAGYDGSLAAAKDLCTRVAVRMDLRPDQCELTFELVGESIRRRRTGGRCRW